MEFISSPEMWGGISNFRPVAFSITINPKYVCRLCRNAATSEGGHHEMQAQVNVETRDRNLNGAGKAEHGIQGIRDEVCARPVIVDAQAQRSCLDLEITPDAVRMLVPQRQQSRYSSIDKRFECHFSIPGTNVEVVKLTLHVYAKGWDIDGKQRALGFRQRRRRNARPTEPRRRMKAGM